MRHLGVLAACLVTMLTAGTARADDTPAKAKEAKMASTETSAAKAEAAAKEAAKGWLKLVDAGDYAASWRQAAALFKEAVTESQWQQAAKAVRGPLGKLVSRKLKSATYATSLPGAPDGHYVVLQYDSAFEHKASAVETVTMMLDEGAWRASGYFIK